MFDAIDVDEWVVVVTASGVSQPALDARALARATALFDGIEVQ